MTTQTAPNINNLQNAFNAAQRAQAILSLILDGFVESITNENVVNSLFAVQGAVDDALGKLEQSIWGDEQATVTDSEINGGAA
ncbi:hypothetical protein ACH50O_02845 [Methylomonas sp. 2BW1-5-20]|uniref:hypothetical protein n=1 Tax=Methylomonas sp. 2BW1-5-20 TaxID=3376686 RepID=UPI00404E77CA